VLDKADDFIDISHRGITSSMKGDVKGQSFAHDRRRRVGLDIQPLTTAVGGKSSESCVTAKGFHRLQVQLGSIF
jgi:hypothetical protein